MREPIKTLVLYDAQATSTNTVYDHLDAFSRHSRQRVAYAHIVPFTDGAITLGQFDVVVLHYSVRVALGWLPDHYRDALARYRGLKVLFAQDEYDWTENLRRSIEELGINVLFTCVPKTYWESVYPRSRFPKLRLEGTLTGYVPEELAFARATPTISERRIVIGYRGRSLPYWYGDLGQEKVHIGKRMREICQARGIPVDIEWEEAHRIYGDRWLAFLSSCKATLATESGSNIFDEQGGVRRAVEAEIAFYPGITYAEVAAQHLNPLEGRIRMNQVSPRVFEAAILRTALVLFEGEYSGVVQPDRHYIPLRKDFANVDEVLRRLADDRGLQDMVDLTHSEIAASGRYGYPQFIKRFDAVVTDCLESPSNRSGSPVDRAPGSVSEEVQHASPLPLTGLSRRPLQARQTWAHRAMNLIWMRTPRRVKAVVRPLARRLYWALMRLDGP